MLDKIAFLTIGSLAGMLLMKGNYIAAVIAVCGVLLICSNHVKEVSEW